MCGFNRSLCKASDCIAFVFFWAFALQSRCRLALPVPAFLLLHCSPGSGLHCRCRLSCFCTAVPAPACIAGAGFLAFALHIFFKLALPVPAFLLLHCSPGPGLHCRCRLSYFCTAVLAPVCIAGAGIFASALQSWPRFALPVSALLFLHCSPGSGLHCRCRLSCFCTAYLLQTGIAHPTNPVSVLQTLSKLALLIPEIKLVHCIRPPNLHC